MVAAAATYLLVVMGAIVRASGSGLGCPDWPLCYGQALPPPHPPAIIEYAHRALAGVTSLLVVAAMVVWVRLRPSRAAVAIAAAAVAALLAQIALGAVTVALELPPYVVLAHLGLAMLLLGLLGAIAIDALLPPPSRGRVGVGGDLAPASPEQQRRVRRLRRMALGAVAAVYVLVLSGALVRASGASWACAGFPACNGQLLPFGSERLVDIHLLHRMLAYAVAAHLVVTLAQVWRARQDRPGRSTAAVLVGTCLIAQLGIGATMASAGPLPVVQVLHVAGAAALWASTVALLALVWGPSTTNGAVLAPSASLSSQRVALELSRAGLHEPLSWERGRLARPVFAALRAAAGRMPALPASHRPRVRANMRDTRSKILAYISLTKPRIILLLLLTTLGSMLLAARGLPTPHVLLFTLVGGALGAGAANAINCCLDRDIDLVMRRTASRAIPSGALQPSEAMVFGLLLAAASLGILAVGVNVLSAILTLGALAFYVLVYTRWLKRASVHNIVIGGAAGAAPPLIGWAAVTGEVGLLALYLFAIVFFWTPPHFWALSLLLKDEYRRAGVPMLPVVRGEQETRLQIVLYTVLLAGLSLAVFGFGLLGALYLAAAMTLGGLFIAFALVLLRTGTDAAARRLFKFSNLYLALLFAAMVVDRQMPAG